MAAMFTEHGMERETVSCV